MKTTIEINGKPVEIELTAEQVATIKKQTADYSDIKTFEDACTYNGICPVEFHKKYGDLPIDAYAYMRLREWNKAINDGQELSYKDKNSKSYVRIWWNSSGSASGFSCNDYDCADGCAYVGSRLLYKDKGRAEHAKKVCFEDFKNHII